MTVLMPSRMHVDREIGKCEYGWGMKIQPSRLGLVQEQLSMIIDKPPAIERTEDFLTEERENRRF